MTMTEKPVGDVKAEQRLAPMDVANIELLHRFHVYCARFPSDIPLRAINEFSRPGEIVFDPFCGSGTTLVAGLLTGRQAWGSDIDDLAAILSWTKTHPWSNVMSAVEAKIAGTGVGADPDSPNQEVTDRMAASYEN